MCKLKKFNNREDNSTTLNSEWFDFNELSCLTIGYADSDTTTYAGTVSCTSN